MGIFGIWGCAWGDGAWGSIVSSAEAPVEEPEKWSYASDAQPVDWDSVNKEPVEWSEPVVVSAPQTWHYSPENSA
jgi:hypothetical protein